MNKKLMPFFMAILVFIPLTLGAITPEEILDKFNKALDIPNISGIFKVRLIAKNGDTREIEARAYQKLTENNESSRLFIFDFPPTVRGTGLLIHSYTDGRENNMWIYLPAIRRVKRIALENSGGGYFMGSDFTYSDLISNDNSKLDFEILEDSKLNGDDCYVMKAFGKTDKIRQGMDYAYIRSYYRKSDYFMIGRDYYDSNNDLLKEYRVMDVLNFGPYIYPTELWMTNVQTGHQSILIVSDPTTDEIPDRYFTTRYLQKQ